MATSQTIPFFAPDGSLVDVPYDQLAAARANKGVIAVRVKGPDGEVHLVPSTRIPEATSKENGGQLLPYEQQEVEHPGFWSSVLEDAFAVPKGIIGSLPPIKAYESIKHGIAEYHALRDSGKTIEQGDNEQLKNEGYGPLYRWLGRPIAQEGAGVNAAAMEQSAREGDEAGVWGHTAVPTVMSAAPIVGEAAARLGGKIPGAGKAVSAASDVLHEVATPENIATAIGGAAGIKLGGALGGIEGGAIGKTIGRALAKRLAQREAEAVYPGANSPTATQSQLYPYLKEGPDPGASLPAAPTPEQLNPALLSPARTLPGQIPPELTPEGYGMVYRAQQDVAAPLPPRTGLSLPPGPEAAPTPTSAPETIGSATEPEVESTRVPSPESIPRTLSGESALRRILTGQDNANLLKIAKSRGLNVTRESQLRPGFADNLLINKIINDMNPEELQHVRDTFLEVGRNRHQFGDIGPEAYKTMSLQTYFPEVKTSLAQQLRTRRAVEQNPARAAAPIEETQQTSKPAPAKIPEGASDDNLLDLLKQSLAKAKEKPSTPIQEGEQSRPFVDQESSTTYGKKNKLVSEEAATAARKNLRTKLFRSNMGLDPTAIADAVKLGTYHVEAGLREFGAWSKQMVDELGPEIRPHLRTLWDEANGGHGTDAPTFYSKAAQVADQKLGGSAPGDTILATLRNAGVKASEIEWTGLDDFLAGKPKVTKAEVKDFLHDNAIHLEETTKTAQPIVDKLKWKPAKTGNNREAWLTQFPDGSAKIVHRLSENESSFVVHVFDEDGNGTYSNEFDSLETAQHDVAREIAGAKAGAPQYEQWTLPGNKSNYTEMLLRLPVERPKVADTIAKEMGFPGGWDFKLTDEQRAKVLERYDAQPKAYKTSHFDEPNILAHVRFDDRIAPDGKKTLFLEEVQSDWHQQGRREGYQKPAAPTDTSGWDVITENENHHTGQRDVRILDKDGDLVQLSSGTRRSDAEIIRDAAERIQRERSKEGLPNAPFKNDWHELAIKRMLRHAAENGYDRMAWVTGEQTGERYSLAKHVDELHYTHYEKGIEEPEQYALVGMKDRIGVFSKVVEAKDLANYVGKEIAARIVRDEGKEVIDPQVSGVTRPIKALSGVDLKIGDEWAKALYDRAIPNFLNKYAKKWGARVEDTQIGAKAPTIDDLQPIWKESHGTLHTAVNNVIAAMQEGKSFSDAMREYGTTQLLESLDKHKLGISNAPVHSINITPAMKKSVLKEGQPIARREELQPSEFASA